MSTRSLIAIESDNKIKSVYVHWDGYLKKNGVVLQENYTTQAQVEALIELGDISSLGPTVGTKHPFSLYDHIKDAPNLEKEQEMKDDFNNQYASMTTYYSRDRDDKDVEPQTFATPTEAVNANLAADIEFAYLFSNNEWLVASDENGWKFESLISQLEDEGIEFKSPIPVPVPTSTTIHLGKIDATDNGIKDNAIDINIKLKDGKFTASGAVWNRLKTDIISGGQNIDEIFEYFPDNITVAKVYTIWKKYHLNDMNAGTQLQEDWLEQQRNSGELSRDASYEDTCEALKEHGLYEVEHNNEPYRYGAAWITQEIPQSIITEIMSIIKDNANQAPKPNKEKMKAKADVNLKDAVNNSVKF